MAGSWLFLFVMSTSNVTREQEPTVRELKEREGEGKGTPEEGGERQKKRGRAQDGLPC